MCILFVYTSDDNVKEGTYRLILISNRDEHYPRLSQSVQNVTDHVVGGTYIVF